jgi:tryptophan synthase beta chain
MKRNNKYIGTMTDERGHFGIYGGRFTPETLMPAAEELTRRFFL